MDIRTLTGELSVSPQLTLADIRAVAEAGYRTLVCNRPDGEAPDQPGFAEIERRAAELGLQARLGLDLCPRLRDLAERKLFLPRPYLIPMAFS